MKLCFLSDCHFGYRIDNDAFTKHIKCFYSETFFPYLIDNKIDTVIQFGDLVDNRRYISIKTLKFINDIFLIPLKDNNITLHTIIGNHDIYYKNESSLNSPKYILSGYDNIHLYENITDVKLDNKTFSFVPWINESNIKKFEKWSEMSSSDVVVGHFEFNGMEYLPNIKSERGISTKSVKRFKEVYSGHYHISSSKDNILYLNTPTEMTFNDIGQEKGFYIYNTNDSDLEFIKNPHVLFRKIIYDDLSVDYDTYDFSIYKDSYVKVYVIKREDQNMYSRFIDKLYESNTIDINVIEQDFELEELEENDVEIQTTIEIINDTVLGLKNIDNSAVISIFDSVYRRAMLETNE